MSVEKLVEEFQDWLHLHCERLSRADYREFLDEIGGEIDARTQGLDEDEK